jgi:hypothetical protein
LISKTLDIGDLVVGAEVSSFRDSALESRSVLENTAETVKGYFVDNE